MAINLNIQPPAIALTGIGSEDGNKILYEIESDAMYASAGAKADFVIDIPLNHATGSKMTLSWGNTTIVFTGVSNPDDSGTQYRALGPSPGDQSEIIGEAFKENYYINNDFIVYYGNDKVRLRAKEEGTDYNLTFNHDQAVQPSTLTTLRLGVDKVVNKFFALMYQLWVYNGDWEQEGNDLAGLTDEDGVLEIDISSMLQEKKTGHFNFPVQDDLLFQHSDLLKAFRLTYFEHYGEDPTPKKIYTTDIRRCIQGSISYIIQQKYDGLATNWYEDFVGKGKFLTLMPDSKVTDANMPEKLYWCAKRAFNTLHLNFKVYYTDGTTTTLSYANTLTNVSEYQVIECHVNYTKAGLHLLAPAKTIDKYEVWLTEGTVKVSEKRTFVVDHDYYEYALYFLLLQDIGFYEAFRSTGKVRKNVKTSKTLGSRETSSYSSTERQKEQISEKTINQYSAHSGNVLSREESLYFIDQFNRSADVFSVKAGQIFPVNILDAQNIADEDSNNIYGFNFKFELSVNGGSVYDLLENTPESTANGSYGSSYGSSYSK